MNIREIAELDLANTLEDAINGFGIPATVTNPDEVSAVLKIQSGDAHLLFDPDTEVSISNRVAHASVRIASLNAAGLGIPRAQPDQSANPWLFEFSDANGNSRKFTVSESKPDRTLGIVTIILELMEP